MDDRTRLALERAYELIDRRAEPRNPAVVAAAEEWHRDWLARREQERSAQTSQRQVPRFLGRRSRDADIDARISRALKGLPIRTEADLKVLVAETVRLVEDRDKDLRRELLAEVAAVMAQQIDRLEREIEDLRRAVADRG